MINDWKYFDFKEVFSFKRGSRYKTEDHRAGNIAYISSTKENNGIDSYVIPIDKMVVYSNAITLNNSGSVGYAFYHPYEFVSSDHCTVIQIRDKSIILDEKLALFIIPLLEAMKPKYNFAREISDTRLSKEKVLLPFNSKGNPDWKFMRNYIDSLAENIIFKSKETDLNDKTKKLTNLENWKLFKYNKIFELKKGKRLTKANILKGDTPFIAATEFNNGYRESIKSGPIHEGNTITVNYNGSVGKAFYQEDPFWASDDVNVLYPKFRLNKYVAMFLIPMIEVERFRYSFGRKWNSDRMELSEIKLPVNKKGEVDVEYMESYIKSLSYSNKI